MVPPTPTTSPRLVRAAAAERDELARHRERLVAARANLRDELDRIEASLGEVEDRVALLTRLVPGNDPRPDEIPGHGGPPAIMSTSETGQPLRGPAIRREAVRVLLDHPDRPEALHYRRWYALLTEAGHTVAGKNPLAVFLTQVSRSPVIIRGTQTGVYAVDAQAPRHLRDRLSELHAELRALAATPDATADVAVIRERRREITAETSRTERALEEAETLLAPTRHLQHHTAD